MAKLTTDQRKNIPSDKFGLPKERKYPIEDRAHAINAKERATQMVNKGKLSVKQQKEIDARADAVIKKNKK